MAADFLFLLLINHSTVRMKNEKNMSKTMTQQSYDKILEAAKILCEYCENNACENCQVTKLTDDAYLDAIEEGIIEDA